MRPLTAFLCLALPLAAAPVPKGMKKPASPDGVWHLVAVHPDGREGSVKDMERYWVVRGETIAIGRPHTNPDRPPPPECKLTTPDPLDPHLRRFGDAQHCSVLQAEGDRLHFCYAHDGRKELTTCKPGQGVVYYVFERVTESK